jgi:N-acetylated-alpha-linked acidic dipeptidase
LSSDTPLPEKRAARIDALLIGVERAMTEDTGLVRRPFFKHLLYAPQPTYREEVLPRIFEAIDDGRWESIARYEKELVAGFGRAAEMLKQARALLGDSM